MVAIRPHRPRVLRTGFTLVELLVVIAIIGILSTIVLVSLNIARNKGIMASMQTNLHTRRSELHGTRRPSSGGQPDPMRTSIDSMAGGRRRSGNGGGNGGGGGGGRGNRSGRGGQGNSQRSFGR